MLKEQFLGRNPSHFKINPIVEAFIFSETFVWSAWHFVIPIVAIFVVDQIEGGDIQIAALAFSSYLIVRLLVEIVVGRYSLRLDERKRFIIAIFGIALVSLCYLGFAFFNTLQGLFLSYAIMGVGLGIATPAKNSLFAMHLDKDREPTEWSMYDAFTFFGMALAVALGGFIASQYGFQFLFLLASLLNILGIVPYVLYINPR